jgi:hypothetical protein
MSKKKHKHLYKKHFEGLEERRDDIFGIGFTPKVKNWVIRYKCKCGKIQVFVNTEHERPDMPEEITFK